MKSKIISILAVSTACLFWSVSFSVSKLLLNKMTPYELAFIRFFLATIFSVIIFYPKIKKVKFNFSYQKPLILAGFLGVTLYFIFENTGLKYTEASEGALIVGSFPALSLLFEIISSKERPSSNRFLGVISSILGVALIIGDSGLKLKFNNLIGDFLILLSGISWIIYNWEIKKVNKIYAYEIITTFQMFWGSLFFIPILFYTGINIPLDRTSIIGIIYLSFFCSALGYLFYNYGLKHLAISQVTNILNLIPLFGAIWGVIFLKESISIIKILGGFFIILGVTLSSLK